MQKLLGELYYILTTSVMLISSEVLTQVLIPTMMNEMTVDD